MKNWYLDIYRFLYFLARPNYALTNANDGSPRVFNKFYLFLAACLLPLRKVVEKYNKISAKMYALASNDGTLISVQAYLNAYYGNGAGYKPIEIQSAYRTMYVGLYPEPPYAPNNSLGLYPQTYNGGADSKALRPIGSKSVWSEIKIDATLQNTDLYDELIADINSLIMYGLHYELTTY